MTSMNKPTNITSSLVIFLVSEENGKINQVF